MLCFTSSFNETSFLAWSYVFPIIGVLLGVFMIVLYFKAKEIKLIKPFLFLPAVGLIYGFVYTAVYCAASLKSGSFTYAYVIRSYEAFIVDFVVWFALLLCSILNPTFSKPKSKNKGNSYKEPSVLSDEKK